MTRFRLAALPYTPAPESRRALRLCFVAAALAHGALLLLPMPWSRAAAAPEPPPRVIHRLVTVHPPEPPPPEPVDPPPEPPTPTATPVPVPEILVDDPVPDPSPLPTPDLETPAEVPVTILEAPPPVPDEPVADGPIHVLGAVVPPEPVFTPEPAYPRAAQQIGRDGIVVLQATIDREGRVTDLEVLRGAPFGMTEAALAAVERWRFRPATLEDRPVAVFYHLTVRFHVR